MTCDRFAVCFEHNESVTKLSITKNQTLGPSGLRAQPPVACFTITEENLVQHKIELAHAHYGNYIRLILNQKEPKLVLKSSTSSFKLNKQCDYKYWLFCQKTSL